MTTKSSDIAALVELFEASKWEQLHVEIDGLHLFLSTDADARLTSANAAAPASSPATAPQARPAAPPVPSTSAAAPGALAQPESSAAVPPHWRPVSAPNLGTFYRSPKPGASPYVEVGQAVERDSDLCLLEVMKLFTAVKAGTKGTVRRICVADGQMVESGQILFYIEES